MQGKKIEELLRHAVDLAQKAATIQPPRGQEQLDADAQQEQEARKLRSYGTTTQP